MRTVVYVAIKEVMLMYYPCENWKCSATYRQTTDDYNEYLMITGQQEAAGCNYI